MRSTSRSVESRFSFVVVVFFFKQKTAYEVRISDWSSDVCSSDLALDVGIDGQHQVRAGHRLAHRLDDLEEAARGVALDALHSVRAAQLLQIGRASCRERVCQYV